MERKFNISEIVEFGIQIEINGKEFYTVLAEKSKDKDIRELFEYLAGEEEKHIGTFRDLLRTVGWYEPPEAYPGEYFDYMKELAGEYVFTKEKQGEIVAKKVKSDKNAVDVGIGVEKESIVFFEGIKECVPVGDYATVNALIGEEQTHLRTLYSVKRKLNKSSLKKKGG